MKKSDIVTEIAKKSTLDKKAIQQIVDSFMETVKESLANDNNVYLRGFGSFTIRKRARKVARNISKNTSIVVPEHFIPHFKPSKPFIERVNKSKVGNNSRTKQQ